MENFQAHNKAVHVIRGSESELRELKELLNPEVAVKASSRRVYLYLFSFLRSKLSRSLL